MSLVQEMAWHRLGAKPFLGPMLTLDRGEHKEQSSMQYFSTFTHFIMENRNEIVVCVFM